MIGGVLERNLVDPVMRPNRQKDNFLTLGKSEQHPITSIDTKTPHLLAFRLELFSVERGMKRILTKKSLLLLSFLLDIGGQQFVSFTNSSVSRISKILVLS